MLVRRSKQLSIPFIALTLAYFLIYEEEVQIHYEAFQAVSVYSSNLNHEELKIREEILNFKEDASKRGYDLNEKIRKLKFTVKENVLVPIPRILQFLFGINERQALDGMCVGEDYIQIEKETLNELSPFQFKALVYHELAHCLLNLEHSEDPNNIMHESGTSLIKEDKLWWDNQIKFIFP